MAGWRGCLLVHIITTEANALMAELQDRMPVILEPYDWPTWLGEVAGDQAVLLKPSAEDVLKVRPVKQAGEQPRNNGTKLWEAVG